MKPSGRRKRDVYIMDKLRRFMYGRYGVDELCYALVILGMVFTFTARVSGIIWFQIPAYLALNLGDLPDILEEPEGEKRRESRVSEGMESREEMVQTAI